MSEYFEMSPGELLPSERTYVTFTIEGYLFGVPITEVHDVFVPQHITDVPLAPAEVGGVLNLRGRIVTALDLRSRLGLPARDKSRQPMAIGIERGVESYGLIIDEAGEVMTLSERDLEPPPDNLDAGWRELSSGIYRLEDRLLIILDVGRLLTAGRSRSAA